MNSVLRFFLLILTWRVVMGMPMSSLALDHRCGSEALLQMDLQEFDEVAVKQWNSDLTIKRNTQSINYRSRIDSNGMIYIPVVFHVMHLPGEEIGRMGTTNLKDDVLLEALNALNLVFKNQGEYDQNIGQSMDVQFCLAEMDSNGNFSNGINRIATTLTTDLRIGDYEQVNELKELSIWNTKEYLNIWVVNDILDYVGFANFPWSPHDQYHGVVVEASSLTNGYSAGLILAHEVGHWSGLYHTFEGGCFNEDCLLNGDRVCDTPPSRESESTANCDANSCSSDADDASSNNPLGKDEQDNLRTYMNYGNPICRNHFTEGQRQRFREVYFLHRSSVVSPTECDDILLNVTGSYAGSIEFVMYPNLVDDHITIELSPQSNYQDVTIGIVSLSGQELIRQSASAFVSSINVSQLDRGMYMLVIQNENDWLSEPFVKN